MRNIFFAAILLMLLQTSLLSASDIILESELISSFGSRADGTEGDKKARNYIAERLDALNISYQRQSLNKEKEGHSFSQNIIAKIPGTSPGQFVIAAPIDNGAFATAFLLNLAEEFSVHTPNNTVILAFLGAERGSSDFHPYGSRIASESLNLEQNIFAIYLDSEQSPQTWEIKIGGNGKVAPYWFTRSLSSVLSSNLISYKLRGADIQVARLGVQGDIGSLNTWLKTDIPTILLKGSGKLNPEEENRQIKHLSNAFISLDEKLKTIPVNRESIYIYLRPFPGFNPEIISELPYISVFLIISALILIAILIRFRDVSLNLHRFSRHWWAGPLLFIIVFLFFFLSTLIVEETLLLADFPTIWTYASGTFIFFKITIAAALSLNFILITRGLPLPRNPHFYSYTSIITAGIATLVFSAMDITLASYSLWTAINMLLFTASKKLHRKSFFLLLSIIPALTGLIVVIREPYSIIIKYLLLSRITGSLILTLLIFPIILAITSLSYWRFHYDRTRQSILTPAATLTLSLSAVITLFWILGLKPYSMENPQPLNVVDRIDLVKKDRRLEISSPAPIGSIDLSLDNKDYPLRDLGRSAEVRMPFNRIPLKVESESRSFLGRRTINVRISGESKPEKLTIHLNSETPFTLHESNYPSEMSPSGTSAEIFIGDNPPFPINLRFTVNNDADLKLSVIGSWQNPEDPPTVTREDIKEKAARNASLEVSI